MRARDFCFWLQGYFEVAGLRPEHGGGLTSAQAEMVRTHLALVFLHEIDPETDAESKAPPGKLDEVHSSPPSPSSKSIIYRC